MFFDRAPAIKDKKQAKLEYTFINAGGKPFQALAVAFIDYFKSTTRVNDATLKKILERFYAYFPKFISHQSYLTPMDRMGMLINSTRKSEVVDCLAYVLRQITIDKVYSNPLNFRKVFDDLDSTVSKDFLRKPDTAVHPSVLRALSEALGINIVLSLTENGKTLPLREVYSSGSTNTSKAELVLQVHEGKYFPRVENEADYAYVGQLAIKPPEPVVNNDQSSGTIAEYIDQINTDNKRLLRTYTQWRQNLLTMVQLDELTTASLITLYIKFLPMKSAIVPDPIAFFSRLTAPTGKPVTVSDSNNSEYINGELAGTLAGWISINQVDPDQLLDYMEKPSMGTASPAA